MSPCAGPGWRLKNNGLVLSCKHNGKRLGQVKTIRVNNAEQASMSEAKAAKTHSHRRFWSRKGYAEDKTCCNATANSPRDPWEKVEKTGQVYQVNRATICHTIAAIACTVTHAASVYPQRGSYYDHTLWDLGDEEAQYGELEVFEQCLIKICLYDEVVKTALASSLWGTVKCTFGP